MLYCEHCGAEIKQHQKHCNQCGMEISKDFWKKIAQSVDVYLVIDRSGSMAGRKVEVETAINKLIDEQKKVIGECNITLISFADDVKVEIKRTPVSDVKGYHNFNSGGLTSLYDAIGKAISDAEHYKPDKAVFIIATDGQENASKEFKDEAIKSLIKKSEEKNGWIFDFIFSGLSVEESKAILKSADVDYGCGALYSSMDAGISSSCSSLIKYRSVGGTYSRHKTLEKD